MTQVRRDEFILIMESTLRNTFSGSFRDWAKDLEKWRKKLAAGAKVCAKRGHEYQGFRYRGPRKSFKYYWQCSRCNYKYA
jgi:hypothetical protein